MKARRRESCASWQGQEAAGNVQVRQRSEATQLGNAARQAGAVRRRIFPRDKPSQDRAREMGGETGILGETDQEVSPMHGDLNLAPSVGVPGK
jgi:hypothetical protein